MLAINLTIPIIILNDCDLNTPIKRQIRMYQKSKIPLYVVCRNALKYKTLID